MKKEPREQPPGAKPPDQGRPQPPPFDPDPRLITQLEGGRKAEAPSRLKRFRKRLIRESNRGAFATKGGYPAGDKLVSELSPPPRGPAPGEKPKGRPGKGAGKSRKK